MLRAGELSRITVQPWPGPWASEGSQVLKRVIGRLSVPLSVKNITGNKQSSDRTTYKGIVLIGIFPPVIGKDFLGKGQKLKGPTNSKRRGAGSFYRPIWILLKSCQVELNPRGFLFRRALAVTRPLDSILQVS